MRRNLARILSIILVFALCLSIAPFTALAEGGSGGEEGDGGSGSSVSLGSGDSYYEGNCSGVRIYLTKDDIIAQNLSSDGKTLTFGKRSNAAYLDMFKEYAIYEISEGSSSTSNYGYGIVNGTKKLYTYFPSLGTMSEAFVLKRDGYNKNPTFKELVGSGHDSFTHWSPWGACNFSKISKWANGVFKDDSTTKVSIDTFLTNYRKLLKETFKVTNAELSNLPKNKSEFVSGNYCIVVEPVMVTAIENGSTDIYVAWSAQDFDGGEKDPKYYYSDSGEYRYKDETLDNANGLCKGMKPSYTRSNFSGRAIQMKKGFYINYTSKKYNQSSSPKGLVTAAPNGVYPNSAGGFAFYYSNDVIAQDVPVQVANTVVVDVGAPKYINGSGSATGGYLGDSGTLRVAVNSTAYLDTSGDPIKSDTSESAKKKGTAYSWYSGGSSFTKQTYSGGKTAVGNFAFNGTAIQSWLDDDSQKKFIKSGHTLSTVKNKNILLSSAVYSCIVNSGAGSISTSPSSVASDLKTQLGLLNLGYSATQLKTTREATTGGVSALGCGVAYTPEIYHSTSTVESTVHSKAKDWVLPLIGGLGGTYRKSYYAKNLEDKLSPAKTGGVTLSTGSLITGREKIAAKIKESSTKALGYSGGLITTVTEGFSEGSIKKAEGKNATAGLSVNVVASDVEVRHRYANVVIDKNGRVGYRNSEYGTVDSTVRDAAHLSFTFDRDARTAGGDYPNVYYLLFPNSETFIGSVFDFGSGTDPLSVSTIKKLANKVRWCDSAVLTESQKNDIMKSVFGKSVDNLDGISAPQFGVLGLPESGSLDIALGAAPYSTSGGASDFTGYTVICVTDYSRTAETLEGTAKLQPYEINYYYDTVLGENTEDELASVRVDNYDTSKIAAVKDSKNKSLKIGETSYYREVSEKNRSNAIDNSISLKMHDADSESNSTGMLKTVNALSTGASDSIKARKNLLIRDLLHVTSIGAFTIDDAFWNASENTAKVTTKNEQNMPKTIVPNYAVGLVRNVLCNEDARDVFSTLHPMNQAAAQAYSSGVYSPKAGSASVSEGVNISFLGNLGFSRFGFSTSVDNARSSGRWQNIGWVPYLWSESSKASAEASGHLSVELEDNFIWTAKRPLTVLLEAVDYVKNTENNITAVHQNAFSNNAQRAKYRLSEVVNSYVTAESDGVALPIDTSTQVLGAKTVSYSFKSNSDSSYRLVASRDSNRTGTLSFYPEVEMRAYLPVTVDNVQYANQDIRGTISGHGSVAPVSLFVLGKRCRNFVTSGINLVSAITGRSWNNTNLSMNGRLSAMTTSTGVSTSANAKALAETLKSKCGGTAPQMLTGGVDVSIGVDLVKNNSGSLSSAVQIKPVSYQVDYVGNNDKDAAVYADAKMYYSPATDSNLDKDPDWRGSARDKAYSSTNDIVASEMSDIAYFKQWLGTAFQNYSSASLAEKYFESVQNNLRSDISLNVYDSSGTFKNSYTGLSNKAGTAYSGNKTNSVATASFPIAIKDGRILGTLENDVTTAVETVNKGCSKTLGDTTEYQLKAALSYRALCLAVYLDINNLEVTDTNVAEHWGTAWEDETVKAYVNNMLKPILNSLETSKSSTNKSSKTNSAAYSGKEVQYAGTKNSEVADGTLRGFKPNSDKWYDEEVRVFTVMRYVPQGVSSSGTVGSQGLGSYLMSPLSASTKIPYDVVPEMGTGIEKEFSTAYLANWSVSVYFEGTVSGLKLSSDDTISSKDAAATAVRNKTAASKKSFLIPNLQIRNSYFGIGNSVTSDRIHN